MQSSACSTTFGDLLLHANSNGKKYFSASFTSINCLFFDQSRPFVQFPAIDKQKSYKNIFFLKTSSSKTMF